MLATSLKAIVQAKLGYLALERINPQELDKLDDGQSEALLEQLEVWFRFDATDRIWTLGNGDFLKDQSPVLFLTQNGIAKAREFLRLRGFMWWKVRKQ